jgi:hypothetical protein
LVGSPGNNGGQRLALEHFYALGPAANDVGSDPRVHRLLARRHQLFVLLVPIGPDPLRDDPLCPEHDVAPLDHAELAPDAGKLFLGERALGFLAADADTLEPSDDLLGRHSPIRC